VVLDLYPGVEFGPFTPTVYTDKSVVEKLESCAETRLFNCMCLDAKKLEELCHLYPNSRQKLATTSLLQRALFMELRQEQIECETAGVKYIPWVVSPQEMSEDPAEL
jgi:hypothetical protein